MKFLNKDDANVWLGGIGMELSDWNGIAVQNGYRDRGSDFIRYRAPRDAASLYCFSQHAAGWLPIGKWKIFQIDNSTSLARDEAFLLARLLCGIAESPDFSKDRTFMFNFGSDGDSDLKSELAVANLVYLFLLFECHGYVVSSASANGEILGIQDGYVYFISNDVKNSGARELIDGFEKNPTRSPKWIRQLDDTEL